MNEIKISPDGRFCLAPDGNAAAFDLDAPIPVAREPTSAELAEIAAQMTWVSVPMPAP